jgi:hypothetical protein
LPVPVRMYLGYQEFWNHLNRGGFYIPGIWWG